MIRNIGLTLAEPAIMKFQFMKPPMRAEKAGEYTQDQGYADQKFTD